MGKFDGILFCTDLDGTLLNKNKTVSKENLEAIEYFKAGGGKFTFITGRMYFYSRETYEMIKPNAPVGCGNGSGVYDFSLEKYLWTTELDLDLVKIFMRYVDEKMPQIGMNVNTPHETLFCKDNEAMVRFRKVTGNPYKMCNYKDLDMPVAKVIFADMDGENINQLKQVIAAHPMADKVDFIGSERTLYEMVPKNINKGTLVLKLAEILGIDKNKTIAIGDFDNDVPMLKAAKLGIAVSNASENAKKVADIITVSNEEHAIAKVIYDIENGSIVI